MEVLAASARADGWSVLLGRCWDGGGAPAYWPWVQVVRAAGGDFDALAPANDDATTRSPRRSSVSSAADPDAERFRLFEEVAAFLDDVSSEQPVMIVLDDLHAADEPSLLLLRFLATTADTRRVIVLGSYRESEPRVLDRADLFGELTRLGRRVPIRGLSVEEVTSYLTLVGGEPTSDAIAARVQSVTGGNPFFLGEVVRVLIAEGRLGSADEAAMRRIPEEVRALIRRHVSTLSPETIGMLRVAAVLGHDLDLRVLADAGPIDVDRMTDAVAEAVRAGILVEDPATPGSFSFVHDLVRETLYDDLPSIRKAELHRTAGDVLERVFREDLGPHLAAIAHHLSQASPTDDGGRAVEYSLLAADRAVAVLAYEDAVALYERALVLLPPSEAQTGRRVGHPDAARRRAGALGRYGRRSPVLRGGGGPLASRRRSRGGGARRARARDQRRSRPAGVRWAARDDDRRSGEHRHRVAGGGAADAPVPAIRPCEPGRSRGWRRSCTSSTRRTGAARWRARPWRWRCVWAIRRPSSSRCTAGTGRRSRPTRPGIAWPTRRRCCWRPPAPGMRRPRSWHGTPGSTASSSCATSRASMRSSPRWSSSPPGSASRSTSGTSRACRGCARSWTDD